MAWSLTMDSAQGLVSSLQGGSQKHHNHGRRLRQIPLMDQDDLALDLDLDLDLDFDEFVDELSSSSPPEKKRRLSVEQVKFLEASFNTDIKLEPDRKALIASQLGLRPRQVAIWFQNRRVRWKNKQLERDYDVLKEKYEALMKENVAMTKEKDTAVAENQKLQAKVAHLTTLLETSKKHMSVTIVDDQGVNLTSLPDFDSDCESGSKELTSLTKSSEDLSDIRDSGQSESASDRDVIVAIVDPLVEEEFETEQHPMFFVEECAMYPLLFFQHLSNVDDPFSVSCWEAMNNHAGSYGVDSGDL